MRVTVVPPGELGDTEADLWARFQRSAPDAASPFLSLTFTQVVGRHRGAARVAVIEDGGTITAFLPFERAGTGPALPVGHPMNNLQGFVSSGAPLDARQVIRQAGLRGWRFDNVRAAGDVLRPHHYAGTQVRCPVVDLSGGYPAYASSLSKSLTSEIARRRRALGRQAGPVTLTWDSATPEDDLRRLVDWKSGKYDGTRQLFADPTAWAIVTELAGSASADCAGTVGVLAAGGQPFAVALWLAGPHELAAWFAAYDPGFRRSSPGTMILLLTAEEAASRGLAHIDLGGGQDEYKFRLANSSYPVAGGAVWAYRAEEAARRAYRRFAHRQPTLTTTG